MQVVWESHISLKGFPKIGRNKMDLLRFFPVATALLLTSHALFVHASTGLQQPSEQVSAQVERQAGLSVEPWFRCINITGALVPLETSPGWGWDALSEKKLGFIPERSWDLCQTTPDGKYILPDAMQAIPIKTSKVKQYSDVYESFSVFESTTASSSTTAKFPIIGGTYSDGFYENKKNQVAHKSVTTRSEVRHEFYKIKVKPDAKLNPQLTNRLLIIGDMIHSNRSKAARHEIELIIRDFGTHMLREITSGGIFQQEVQVTLDYAKNSEATPANIRAAASSTFFSKVGVQFNYFVNARAKSQFLNNVTQSSTRTFGGKPYVPQMNVSEWEEDLSSSLAAIKSRPEPIEYIITPHTVPELPAPTVRQISNELAEASAKYIDINTHQGCTDVNAANFDFNANFADETLCRPIPHNYTFGGIYQTCTVKNGQGKTDFCKPFLQKNPSTGDFSCPQTYEPVLLHEGFKTTNWDERSCGDFKRICFWAKFVPYTCYKWDCQTIFYASSAVYKTYWCVNVNKVAARSGYLFGGLYTEQTPNPVTEQWNCPKYFYALTFGNGWKICISNNYDKAPENARPLGGFYSCSMGNPLPLLLGAPTAPSLLSEVGFDAITGPDSWPKRCPVGYSARLVGIDDGCWIEYCTKDKPSFIPTRPRLIRPPYGRPYPPPGNQTIDVTEINGPGGPLWSKNLMTGVWSKVHRNQATDNGQLQDSFLDSTSDSSSTLLYTLVPAGVVFSVLGVALLAARRKIGRLETEKALSKRPRSHNPDVLFSASPGPENDVTRDPGLKKLAESFPATSTPPPQVKQMQPEATNIYE